MADVVVCGRGAEKVLESAELARFDQDDVELFLFRVPPGFDPSALHGLKLPIDADETCVGDDGRFALRPVPLCESAAMVPAFPSKDLGRWVTTRPFAAQYSVVLRPPTTSERMPVGPGELPEIPQLQGLRLRHPFKGGEMPPVRDPAIQAARSRRDDAGQGLAAAGREQAHTPDDGKREKKHKKRKHGEDDDAASHKNEKKKKKKDKKDNKSK
eukprot:scaffold48368_cov32-Tisochrysis_lutea.AAC.1